MKRIVFRADASHAIGFGHVARLCALIEEVSDNGDEPILMFGGDRAAVSAWVRDRGLPAIHPHDYSADQTARAAEEMRASCVVLDGPQIVRDLAPMLAERKLRAVIIDDNGKLDADAFAVVNHNIHAPSLANTYRAPRRLLGRRYLLLRREMRKFTRGSCRPMAGSRLRVIVTFGGSDPVGATARTLRLLPEDRPLELVVITGPGFRDDGDLASAAAVACSAGHTVDVRRAPEDPGALFVSADAAICSAGGTLGELAYLGLPAIAYAIARDQIVPAREQVRRGLIAGGRTWEETDDDTLRADLARFMLDDRDRADMRVRALQTVDAEGAKRVVEEALGCVRPARSTNLMRFA